MKLLRALLVAALVAFAVGIAIGSALRARLERPDVYIGLAAPPAARPA